MENPHTTNGKSLLSLPPHQPDTPHAPTHPSHIKILDLVKVAIDLELRLKSTMGQLEAEMKAVGDNELPTVLMTLAKGMRTAPVRQGPEPKLQKPINRGGALKARVLGVLSDKQEHKSSDIIKALKSKNKTSVYAVLTQLVIEEHVIKTRFAHYRLKQRHR